MPREFSRGHRIADLIAHELAILIQTEVRDPRVGMVTINEVKVSRDLSYANVYFTKLGESDQKVTVEALSSAAGFLRSRLAKVLTARTTPKLRFIYDDSVENGARMSKAIEDALKRDRALPGHNEQSSDDEQKGPCADG